MGNYTQIDWFEQSGAFEHELEICLIIGLLRFATKVNELARDYSSGHPLHRMGGGGMLGLISIPGCKGSVGRCLAMI